MNRPNKRPIIQMEPRHRITRLAIMLLGVQQIMRGQLHMGFSRGIRIKIVAFTKPFYQPGNWRQGDEISDLGQFAQQMLNHGFDQ